MNSKTYAKIFKGTLLIISLIMAFSAIKVLPDLAKHSASIYEDGKFISNSIIYYVWLSAIPFYLVIYQVIKICNFIIQDEIFTDGPVKALDNISLLSVIIGLMYIGLLIFLYILKFFPPTMVLVLSIVIFSSFSISIMAKIMRLLLSRAIEIKEENDFTI